MADSIVVLFGGPSGERLVSVASAQHVATVLDGAKLWFLSQDGSVHEVDRGELLVHERAFENEFVPRARARFAHVDAALGAPEARDAVFVIALHGTYGEDGTLQRAFEQRRIAFTGSGSRASAQAFDKAVAKRIVAAVGIQTADAVLLPAHDAETIARELGRLVDAHGRAVAKPLADGSSVGLHHVRGRSDVVQAAEAIARSGRAYLAEAFVSGTELTVGVVDMGEGPRALCASEVRVDPGRAFDYQGKYLGSGTQELTPATVGPDVARAAHELAVDAHRALGCEGYSRTDMIVTERGPVFLETNTLPGLTRASFLPQQLAHVGIAMPQFLEAQMAIARRRARTAL